MRSVLVSGPFSGVEPPRPSRRSWRGCLLRSKVYYSTHGMGLTASDYNDGGIRSVRRTIKACQLLEGGLGSPYIGGDVSAKHYRGISMLVLAAVD